MVSSTTGITGITRTEGDTAPETAPGHDPMTGQLLLEIEMLTNSHVC